MKILIILLSTLHTNMENKAAKRINNEYQEIQKNPPTNWKVFTGAAWNKWTVWVTADV
ncbi:MAG: hypothetical protein KDD45_04530 [Bdellovibrionales bacterium]|nr:hypothetical protein [Bdellovibrionales bacterium]